MRGYSFIHFTDEEAEAKKLSTRSRLFVPAPFVHPRCSRCPSQDLCSFYSVRNILPWNLVYRAVAAVPRLCFVPTKTTKRALKIFLLNPVESRTSRSASFTFLSLLSLLFPMFMSSLAGNNKEKRDAGNRKRSGVDVRDREKA